MVSYFFDSYALIEIIKGNENYKKYTMSKIIITKLNLIECYNSWISEMGEEKANHYFKFFNPCCMPVLDEDIKEGVKFRIKLKNNNKRISPSYIDCIGYVISLRLNMKFLTGDNVFKDFPNVEFVK